MSQLVLGHGVRVVDLVPEDQKRRLREVFHGQEGVEFSFCFGQTFMVLGVDEEHNSRDFGEVVAPKTAGCAAER